jgi:cysteine-rich repeat protein
MPPTAVALLLATAAALVPRPVSAAIVSTAADVCAPTVNPCTVTADLKVASGATLDFGARALVIARGASLDASPGGMFTINAGSLTVQPGGQLLARSATGGFGGDITVNTSGDIAVQVAGTTSGRIDVSGDAGAGDITLNAGGAVSIDGLVVAHASTSDGDGGCIMVTAGGTIGITGRLDTSSGSQGAGGMICLAAVGTVSVSGVLDATGGDFDGGEIDVDSSQASVTLGELDVPGGGTSGSGGTVMITAQQDITLQGPLNGPGGGQTGQGGDGADITVIANRSTRVLAPVNAVSGPDGSGGSPDIEGTNGDVVVSAAIKAAGIGTDSCGGDVFLSAAGNLSVQQIDASGGTCGGGDIQATAVNGTLSLPAELDADGTAADSGGSMELAGQVLQVGAAAKLHANSGFGSITLTACTLGVAAGAQVSTTGEQSTNLFQASGLMTIAGTVVSGGVNIFQYLDPTRPPVVTGSVTPPPQVSVNPALAPCHALAVCGNGRVEPGEQCDDGNNAACDGCSPTCALERCGNGVVDCGEQCDLGPQNGAPGQRCDATCHVVTVSGLLALPGRPTPVEGCYLEWQIRNPNGAVNKGFPARKQTCIDGDPSCDADGLNDGGCSFEVGTCLHVPDPRLPSCLLYGIQSVNLRRPNALSPADATDAANVAALVSALETTPVALLSGTTVLQVNPPLLAANACSPLVTLRVPHARGKSGERSFTLAATAVDGKIMRSNHVRLVCANNPAVCGNGRVEIGEQCDDGNTRSCDGCSASCRVEACGNGVVECIEECDDGANNGTPGDPCTAQCTLAPPALRIGGGGRGAGECDLEWSLAIGAPALDHQGLPDFKQSCRLGDPSCDFSTTPGVCRFHVWACLGGADPRYTCGATAVSSVELLAPSVRKTGVDGAARAALAAGLGALRLPAGPGEVCTPRINVDVPAGRHRVVFRTRAHGADGTLDTDGLKLRCLPP